MISEENLRVAIQRSELYIAFHDFGSADPDDMLAGLLWLQALQKNPDMCLVIVATHFRAPQRAEMAGKMLSHPRLEIRAAPDMSELEFYQSNPLWPTKIFGDPFNNPGEKVWFPDFGKAFAQLPAGQWYPLGDRFDDILALCREKYDSGDNLSNCGKICLCSPLEAVELIPAECDKYFTWTAMGGCQANGTSGYNWGLNSHTLQYFQARMSKAQKTVYCITSAMAESCCLSKSQFDSWCAIAEQSPANSKQRALVDECRRSFAANALNSQKKMADPIAVFLALCLTPLAGLYGYYSTIARQTYLQSQMDWHSSANACICIPTMDLTKVSADILDQLDQAFRNL